MTFAERLLVVAEVKEVEVWSGEGTDLAGAEWKLQLPAGGHKWVIFEAS